MNDGIELFDLHTSSAIEFTKLSRHILCGDYIPERGRRILVEKSKGLCRQLVIPSARDAVVLKCLSDALYSQIRKRSPTDRAFFEPKEHRFSSQRGGYGTFAAWLNFQKALFSFSQSRHYVVVTDIANYYDSISYLHLRNVVASTTEAEESVLDMLIFVLSGLLWQPDYMPRIEIGLPQINMDAPRILAHCFLYELDKFLASQTKIDFVRFMDDIDLGVDSIGEAKCILKEVDLILQTRQLRLNSGKTEILTSKEAIRHFRVWENARLDRLETKISKKRERASDLDRERLLISKTIAGGLSKKHFDVGNGEKILKRWVRLAGEVKAKIKPFDLRRMFLLRPAMREPVCAYIRRTGLTLKVAEILASCAESKYLVDDAAMVDLSNYLVETQVIGFRNNKHIAMMRIINSCDLGNYFGVYCRLWLQSKYDTTTSLLGTIDATQEIWGADDRLGRLVGAFFPLFQRTREQNEYLNILEKSRNGGARATYKFHTKLAGEKEIFDSMFDALRNTNPSRGTGITHAKFLCLLSALQNASVPDSRKSVLTTNHIQAWHDYYYRGIARRLKVLRLRTPPVAGKGSGGRKPLGIPA